MIVLGLDRLGQVIARELQSDGAIVSICGLDEKKTEAVAGQLGARAIPIRVLYNTLADVIVLADPAIKAGSGRHEVNPGYIRPNMTVLDVSSLPDLHPLAKEAADRDAKVVPATAVYAMHLDAVMKTLTGSGLDDDAREELIRGT